MSLGDICAPARGRMALSYHSWFAWQANLTLKTRPGSARPSDIAPQAKRKGSQDSSIAWKRCTRLPVVGRFCRSRCIRPARLRFRPESDGAVAALRNNGWEADERPEPRSLGLLPSGSDPVGEWLVHRQPPISYIGRGRPESKRGQYRGLERFASVRKSLRLGKARRFCYWGDLGSRFIDRAILRVPRPARLASNRTACAGIN